MSLLGASRALIANVDIVVDNRSSVASIAPKTSYACVIVGAAEQYMTTGNVTMEAVRLSVSHQSEVNVSTVASSFEGGFTGAFACAVLASQFVIAVNATDVAILVTDDSRVLAFIAHANHVSLASMVFKAPTVVSLSLENIRLRLERGSTLLATGEYQIADALSIRVDDPIAFANLTNIDITVNEKAAVTLSCQYASSSRNAAGISLAASLSTVYDQVMSTLMQLQDVRITAMSNSSVNLPTFGRVVCTRCSALSVAARSSARRWIIRNVVVEVENGCIVRVASTGIAEALSAWFIIGNDPFVDKREATLFVQPAEMHFSSIRLITTGNSDLEVVASNAQSSSVARCGALLIQSQHDGWPDVSLHVSNITAVVNDSSRVVCDSPYGAMGMGVYIDTMNTPTWLTLSDVVLGVMNHSWLGTQDGVTGNFGQFLSVICQAHKNVTRMLVSDVTFLITNESSVEIWGFIVPTIHVMVIGAAQIPYAENPFSGARWNGNVSRVQMSISDHSVVSLQTRAGNPVTDDPRTLVMCFVGYLPLENRFIAPPSLLPGATTAAASSPLSLSNLVLDDVEMRVERESRILINGSVQLALLAVWSAPHRNALMGTGTLRATHVMMRVDTGSSINASGEFSDVAILSVAARGALQFLHHVEMMVARTSSVLLQVTTYNPYTSTDSSGNAGGPLLVMSMSLGQVSSVDSSTIVVMEGSRVATTHRRAFMSIVAVACYLLMKAADLPSTDPKGVVVVLSNSTATIQSGSQITVESLFSSVAMLSVVALGYRSIDLQISELILGAYNASVLKASTVSEAAMGAVLSLYLVEVWGSDKTATNGSYQRIAAISGVRLEATDRCVIVLETAGRWRTSSPMLSRTFFAEGSTMIGNTILSVRVSDQRRASPSYNPKVNGTQWRNTSVTNVTCACAQQVTVKLSVSLAKVIQYGAYDWFQGGPDLILSVSAGFAATDAFVGSRLVSKISGIAGSNGSLVDLVGQVTRMETVRLLVTTGSVIDLTSDAPILQCLSLSVSNASGGNFSSFAVDTTSSSANASRMPLLVVRSVLSRLSEYSSVNLTTVGMPPYTAGVTNWQLHVLSVVEMGFSQPRSISIDGVLIASVDSNVIALTLNGSSASCFVASVWSQRGNSATLSSSPPLGATIASATNILAAALRSVFSTINASVNATVVIFSIGEEAERVGVVGSLENDGDDYQVSLAITSGGQHRRIVVANSTCSIASARRVTFAKLAGAGDSNDLSRRRNSSCVIMGSLIHVTTTAANVNATTSLVAAAMAIGVDVIDTGVRILLSGGVVGPGDQAQVFSADQRMPNAASSANEKEATIDAAYGVLAVWLCGCTIDAPRIRDVLANVTSSSSSFVSVLPSTSAVVGSSSSLLVIRSNVSAAAANCLTVPFWSGGSALLRDSVMHCQTVGWQGNAMSSGNNATTGGNSSGSMNERPAVRVWNSSVTSLVRIPDGSDNDEWRVDLDAEPPRADGAMDPGRCATLPDAVTRDIIAATGGNLEAFTATGDLTASTTQRASTSGFHDDDNLTATDEPSTRYLPPSSSSLLNAPTPTNVGNDDDGITTPPSLFNNGTRQQQQQQQEALFQVTNTTVREKATGAAGENVTVKGHGVVASSTAAGVDNGTTTRTAAAPGRSPSESQQPLRPEGPPRCSRRRPSSVRPPPLPLPEMPCSHFASLRRSARERVVSQLQPIQLRWR